MWSGTWDAKVTRFLLPLRRLINNQIQTIFLTVFLELKELLKQLLEVYWIKNRERNLKIHFKSTEWKTYLGGGKHVISLFSRFRQQKPCLFLNTKLDTLESPLIINATISNKKDTFLMTIFPLWEEKKNTFHRKI